MRDDMLYGRKEILKYMVKLWSIMAILLAIITGLLHATSGGTLQENILLAILPVVFIVLIGEPVYRKVVDNSSLNT